MGRTAQSRLKPAQNGTGSRLLQCTPRRRTTALPLRTSSLPRGLLRARVCGRAYCGACMSLAGPALRTSSLPRGFLRGARLWPYLRSIPLPFPPLLLLQFSSLFSCIFLRIFLFFFSYFCLGFLAMPFFREEKKETLTAQSTTKINDHFARIHRNPPGPMAMMPTSAKKPCFLTSLPWGRGGFGEVVVYFCRGLCGRAIIKRPLCKIPLSRFSFFVGRKRKEKEDSEDAQESDVSACTVSDTSAFLDLHWKKRTLNHGRAGIVARAFAIPASNFSANSRPS